MVGSQFDIHLKTKRKQLRYELKNTLHKVGIPDAEGCRELYSLWNEFYPLRSLIIAGNDQPERRILSSLCGCFAGQFLF